MTELTESADHSSAESVSSSNLLPLNSTVPKQLLPDLLLQPSLSKIALADFRAFSNFAQLSAV